MRKSKIVIFLDDPILDRLDRLIRKQVFPNRSQAVQEAVKEKLGCPKRNRLARECAKLDQSFEKVLAEEGLSRVRGSER